MEHSQRERHWRSDRKERPCPWPTSDPVLVEVPARIAHGSGLILLTGPSGSGKTTTLYAALAHIRSQAIARSMVSVEPRPR